MSYINKSHFKTVCGLCSNFFSPLFYFCSCLCVRTGMSVHFLVTAGADREPGTVSTNIPANVSISNNVIIICCAVCLFCLLFSHFHDKRCMCSLLMYVLVYAEHQIICLMDCVKEFCF